MYTGTFAGQWSETQPLLKQLSVQSGAELWEGVRQEPANQWHEFMWFKINTTNDKKTLQFHPSLTRRQKPTLSYSILQWTSWSESKISTFPLIKPKTSFVWCSPSGLLNLLICVYNYKYRDHNPGRALSKIPWCRLTQHNITPSFSWQKQGWKQ